jgi:hypothetical protein
MFREDGSLSIALYNVAPLPMLPPAALERALR